MTMNPDWQGGHDGASCSLLAQPLPVRPPSINYGFSGDRDDLRACTASIRRGSKSFHLASMILPAGIRQAAHALYAFCRHSDDLVDNARTRHDALSRLRARLDQIYAGTPAAHACDRAFARTVHAHAIPKIVADALLDGFAMDLDDTRYQTIEDLKGYATCVASTVGIMMAMVMGRGDERALARAADLGIAMQLTNIARDVGEDARNGRLYLPLDWLEEAGIDGHAFLRDPQYSPAMAGVVRRLLAEAERYYRMGHAGIGCLPADCRHAIRTAALVYEEIGARIAANGHDSITRRAHTPLSVKLALMMRARKPAEAENGSGMVRLDAPTDPASRRLVQAASTAFASLEGRPKPHGEFMPQAGDSAIDRFSVIMMRLQSRTREGSRYRRLAAREKAGGLV